MGIKISSAFPSKWLKSEDIGRGKKIRCVIEAVELETIADEDKPVMYFRGKSKGMILNKTNAGRIAVAYGDNTDDWLGKEIFVYVEDVTFQGRMVPALRASVPLTEVVEESFDEPNPQPRRKKAAAPAAPQRPHPESEENDDEHIPF